MTADKDRVTLLHGDCRELLKSLPDQSIDSIVTDPPYELGFMGRKWDASGIAYDLRVWRECLRVLKPGGHLLAFGGTRTYHRMTCAIEDAGFEIRDCIMWVYGSGFPKSHDVSKALDKAAGAEREVIERREAPVGFDTERQGGGGWSAGEVLVTAPATDAAKQWQGWGSALKPAVEPIVVARKPLDGTIADNVLRHGTGAINVDGCRVETDETLGRAKAGWGNKAVGADDYGNFNSIGITKEGGRWPANLIHDGSDEVVGLFPQAPSAGRYKQPEEPKDIGARGADWSQHIFRAEANKRRDNSYAGDSGSAARFFYCAKTSPSERGDNNHPTVKPLALMRYLCRLITPPRGTVLDPFAGSGSTMVAARQEGFGIVACELEAAHIEIIKGRLDMPIEAEQAEAEQGRQEAPKTSKPTQLKLLL